MYCIRVIQRDDPRAPPRGSGRYHSAASSESQTSVKLVQSQIPAIQCGTVEFVVKLIWEKQTVFKARNVQQL